MGELYLNWGKWDERQIVSSGWIAECKKEHSRWVEMNLPYGYLWWIVDDKAPAYAAMGDSGNAIYVNGKKKLVISIASLEMQNAKDRLELIRNHIEPIFESRSNF